MATSSRRLSKRGKRNANNHTPGKDKGGFCVRPINHGIAVNSNPYKGNGLGRDRNAYDNIWKRYYSANKGAN